MNRVKEFRKEKKMSQLELAKSIGVSRQTINMIENNKYNPTLELCINLARALDTDLNALFWEPAMKSQQIWKRFAKLPSESSNPMVGWLWFIDQNAF